MVDVLEDCNTILIYIILSSSLIKEDIHVFVDIPYTQSAIQSDFPATAETVSHPVRILLKSRNFL